MNIPLPLNAIVLHESERKIIQAHFSRLKQLQEESQRESETLQHLFGVIGFRATGILDPKGYSLDVAMRAILPRSEQLTSNAPNGECHEKVVSNGKHHAPPVSPI